MFLFQAPYSIPPLDVSHPNTNYKTIIRSLSASTQLLISADFWPRQRQPADI